MTKKGRLLMPCSVDFAFLDSGTGGIPYMLDLKEKCPKARCVYLGDAANFPYGEKTADEICSCATSAVQTIINLWQPKTVVIACNTISVTALKQLREHFPFLPIVGTVPAIRLAARTTKNKRIGLLATNATVKHPYNAKLISDFAYDCKVFSRGDPDLVSFIEHDLFTATKEERIRAVEPAVSYFKDCGCDTIILGCTHFTHIANDISYVAGKDISIVDSRNGVALQALRVESSFAGENQNSSNILPPDESFFVTGYVSQKDEAEYKALCNRFNIPWGGVVK